MSIEWGTIETQTDDKMKKLLLEDNEAYGTCSLFKDCSKASEKKFVSFTKCYTCMDYRRKNK